MNLTTPSVREWHPAVGALEAAVPTEKTVIARQTGASKKDYLTTCCQLFMFTAYARDDSISSQRVKAEVAGVPEEKLGEAA